MSLSPLQDPIDLLAAHFRSFDPKLVGKHASLRIPSFLREALDRRLDLQKESASEAKEFKPREVKDLVESIGEEEFERWCFLDATAFTFVGEVLLRAEPCLAKDQGFFRLIVSDLLLEALETLRDEKNELGMSKELLSDYKDSVGRSLAVKLLGYFTDTKGSGFSRRWIGLLLVELLEESEVNRELVWDMSDKTFKGIGDIIITGDDRMLKIVAGKIIWHMVQNFGNGEVRHRLSGFWQSNEAEDFTNDFPLQDGTQWENNFADFVTKLEEDRYDLDLGLPTGYNGMQVKLGNSPISWGIAAISVNIDEIFSIYIPPNRDRSHDWVDFKIVNINRIELTSQGVTGDAMDQLIYFKIYLYDFEKDGYLYLLSMRPSSASDNVMILCYKNEVEELAEDVKRCQQRILQQKRNRSSAPIKDIQVNPAQNQSQQEKLDELERHREDILKVLGSPVPDDINSATKSDKNVEEALPIVEQEAQREMKEAADKETMEVDLVEINGADNTDPSYLGGDSPLTSVIDSPVANIPNIATRKITIISDTIPSGRMIPALNHPESVFNKQKVKVLQVANDHPNVSTQLKMLKQLDTETPAVRKPDEYLDRKPKPVISKSTKIWKAPVIQESQENEDNETSKSQRAIPAISYQQRSQDAPAEGKPRANKLNDDSRNNTQSSISKVVGNLDDLRTPPNTHQTKNRAKTKANMDGGISNRKMETAKPNIAPKTRAVAQNLEKSKLISPEDTSIWDLPDSDGSRDGGWSLKKEFNVPNAKQPTKRKLPPKKRTYGKVSVIKRNPKSNKMTLDSGEVMKSVEETVLPVHDPKTKRQPKRQAALKSAPIKYSTRQDNDNKGIELAQKEKVPIRSLRSGKKLDPKRKVVPEPILAQHKIAQGNEDQEMKPVDEKPPTPVPMLKTRHLSKLKPKKPKPKLAPNSVPTKRTVIQSSEDEEMRSAEEEKIPSRSWRSTTTRKFTSALVSAKRLAVQNSGDEGRELRGEQQIFTKPLKVALPLTRDRHIAIHNSASDGSGSEYVRLTGKRNKVKQVKPTMAKGNMPPRPAAKKPLENLKKRSKVELRLDTSEADEHSPWKPKTRLQTKLELATKSAGPRNTANVRQINHEGIIPEENLSDKFSLIPEHLITPTPKPRGPQRASSGGNTLSILGSRHKRIQRSLSIGSEASVKIPIKPHAKDILEGELEITEEKILVNLVLETSIQPTPGAIHELEGSKTKVYYTKENNIVLVPSDHSSNSSDSEEMEPTGTAHRVTPQRNNDTDKLTRIESRVITYDDTKTPPTSPHNLVVATVKDGDQLGSGSDMVGGDTINNGLEEQAKQDSNRPLAMGYANLTKEAPLFNAAINLEITIPSSTNGSNNQTSSDSSRALTPPQERNKTLLIPLVTPRMLAKTPQTLQRNSEVLVDDRLARKAQIISWNNEGPKNQGRTPVIDKTHMHLETTTEQKEFSSDDIFPLPMPERAPSFYVFASEDEDRIIPGRKDNLRPLIFRPTRRALGTVVNKNGSPLVALTQERIKPVEHLRIAESRGDIGEEQEVEENLDLAMANIMNDPDYVQRRLSMESEQESEASTEVKQFKRQRWASHADLWDVSNADALETGNLLSSEDQASSVEDIEEVRGLLDDNGLAAMKEEVPQPDQQGCAYREISIIEITESDSESAGGVIQLDSFKPPGVERRGPNRNLTLKKSQAVEKFIGLSFSETKERFPALGKSTILSETKIPSSKAFQLGSMEAPTTLISDKIPLGVPTGRDNRETRFFKWLRESEFKKANNGSRNNQTANGKIESKDPDETLVNESDHSGRGKNQGQKVQGKNTLSNSSDDSDFSMDFEGSDTDDEHTIDEEPSEENPQVAWRQSLPDYHKETLGVLDQISQGLLRYLMSGEELAMEVIKDFEKQGNEIVKQLGDSHKREYNEFLTRIELAKGKVQKEHTEIMEHVEDGMAKLGKQAATLSCVRRKIDNDYNSLDNKISELMAGLEEELRETMEL